MSNVKSTRFLFFVNQTIVLLNQRSGLFRELSDYCQQVTRLCRNRLLCTTSFPLGETVISKGHSDEIKTSLRLLYDYKSTNQTDGGQMGAELTEHPFCSTSWSLCLKMDAFEH